MRYTARKVVKVRHLPEELAADVVGEAIVYLLNRSGQQSTNGTVHISRAEHTSTAQERVG